MKTQDENATVRIIERTFHCGNSQFVVQRKVEFLGWSKWRDIPYDAYHDTFEQAEPHVEQWLPKPKPINKIVKEYSLQ